MFSHLQSGENTVLAVHKENLKNVVSHIYDVAEIWYFLTFTTSRKYGIYNVCRKYGKYGISSHLRRRGNTVFTVHVGNMENMVFPHINEVGEIRYLRCM